MKYCSNCGNPIDENAKFCENCGQQMEPSVQQQPTANIPNNSSNVDNSHGYYSQQPNSNNMNSMNNPNVMNNQNGYPPQPPKQSNGCLIAFLISLGVVLLLVVLTIMVPVIIGYNSKRDEENDRAYVPETVEDVNYIV